MYPIINPCPSIEAENLAPGNSCLNWKSSKLQFPDIQFLARKLGISPSLFVRQIS